MEYRARREPDWATEPLDEDLVKEIEALVAPVLNTVWLSGRTENNLGKIYA